MSGIGFEMCEEFSNRQFVVSWFSVSHPNILTVLKLELGSASEPGMTRAVVLCLWHPSSAASAFQPTVAAVCSAPHP